MDGNFFQCSTSVSSVFRLIGNFGVPIFLYVVSLANIYVRSDSTTTAAVRPPLPTSGPYFGVVGTTDAFALLTDGEVVDKSLFIKEYLEDPERVILITRPRRFGKTVNLEMLRRFLELEVDPDGELLPEHKQVNKKLFLGGTIATQFRWNVTLKPLKIARDENSLKHLGRYPVIFAQFDEVEPHNYDDFENSIRKYFRLLYHRYQYIRRKLSDEDKVTFDKFYEERANSQQLENGLRFLSTKVAAYFNRTVHILVDDYEAPLQQVLTKHLHTEPRATYQKKLSTVLSTDRFKKGVNLLATILSNTFNNNSALEKAVVTGILPLVKSDMAQELGQLTQYTVLDERFSNFFGFTQNEVDKLLQTAYGRRPELLAERKLEVEKWYKGYNFLSGRKSLTLYNPWSVMAYLQQDGQWKEHWTITGYFELCEHQLVKDDVQDDLQKLANGLITVKTEVIDNGFALSDLIDGPFYRYLLITGYLTPTTFDKKVANKSIIELAVPNYEVKMEFVEQAINWAKVKYNITVYDDLSDGKEILCDGKVDGFRNWLNSKFSLKSAKN